MILNNWHIGHRVTSYSVGVERTCPLCGRLFRKLTPNQKICAGRACKNARNQGALKKLREDQR